MDTCQHAAISLDTCLSWSSMQSSFLHLPSHFFLIFIIIAVPLLLPPLLSYVMSQGLQYNHIPTLCIILILMSQGQDVINLFSLCARCLCYTSWNLWKFQKR